MNWKSFAPSAAGIRFTSSVAALGCLAGSFAAILFAPSPNWGWAGALALLTLFCAALGVAINGRLAGVLIDERNRVSLARFQASAWSVLVLSALLTAVLSRIRAGDADPLAIAIPGQLLVAMGMSAASFVSSPALLSLKAGELAQNGVVEQTCAKLGDASCDVVPQGKLYARCDPTKARWLDMFRGEEVCNAAAPDLSKVQQFLVTIIVLSAYGATLWSGWSGASLKSAAFHTGYLSGLPDFSPNMLWLIGLSHAGYLAYKVAPHGPAARGASAAAADAVG